MGFKFLAESETRVTGTVKRKTVGQLVRRCKRGFEGNVDCGMKSFLESSLKSKSRCQFTVKPAVQGWEKKKMSRKTLNLWEGKRKMGTPTGGAEGTGRGRGDLV
ncbi:MAG: hypothetical protein ACUVUD_03925 [bacterium]